MNIMDRNTVTLPQDAILNMNMTPNSGYHLAELDFKIIVFTDSITGKMQEIDKSECTKVDDDNYEYYPDTQMLGRGKYYAKLIVTIPDQRHPNGRRELSMVTEAGLHIK